MPDPSNFDAIAKYYDQLARMVFGKAIRDAQTCFLNRIPENANVLVLGGGTGWWLNELNDLRPACRIRYVEASVRMLALAKKNSKPGCQIEFVLGTEESIGGEQFDVIITFFFLDLFEEEQLQKTILTIKSHMPSKGVWLVADFLKTSWWHKAALFFMYTFFRMTTGLRTKRLSDWNKSLNTNGLVEKDTRYFYGGFIKSAVFSVL
jgi:tRNA (cmo5U34)-methyltransferase